MPRQTTKVTRTTLDMEPALIEPTNGTSFINHNTIISKRIMARSLAIFCEETFPRLRVPQLAVATLNQKQRQMDTADTAGQNHDAHYICSKTFVSLSFDCEPFIFQHEQTCQRIFHCICKRKTKASSLHPNVYEETERQERRHGLSHGTSPIHQLTKLEATPSVKNCVREDLQKQFTIRVTGTSSCQPQNQEERGFCKMV